MPRDRTANFTARWPDGRLTALLPAGVARSRRLVPIPVISPNFCTLRHHRTQCACGSGASAQGRTYARQRYRQDRPEGRHCATHARIVRPALAASVSLVAGSLAVVAGTAAPAQAGAGRHHQPRGHQRLPRPHRRQHREVGRHREELEQADGAAGPERADRRRRRPHRCLACSPRPSPTTSRPST